ncbi:MAG: S-methyl-5'-thioinosine phosphorylase [Gammaproteobacteria bacterium]|nr:S-methyl-5'-thioinosine phosphorylase [Gammaproteobacteria bacterium]
MPLALSLRETAVGGRVSLREATTLLAIIGGTGFGEFAGVQDIEPQQVETEFGSVYLESGALNGTPLLFLPRHGNPPRLPPHIINYRANIDALIATGADKIIAVTAVGTVDESLCVPELVIPDQLIDYTYGRVQTYYDDELHHIDLTFPYDQTLRQQLVESAIKCQKSNPKLLFRNKGVYGCLQGPRLETAAEIRRLRIDGCDIVGMTAMPECTLARERHLPYAGISVTINAGAGINQKVVDIDHTAMDEGMTWIRDILSTFVSLE